MSMFVDLLASQGASVEDISKAQTYQEKYGGRLEQILVNMGGLAAESLPNVYSAYLGLSVLDPSKAAAWMPPEFDAEVPVKFLVERGWIPFSKDSNGRVLLATKNPLDLEVNEWLVETGFEFEIVLISDEQFSQCKGRLGIDNESEQPIGLDVAEEGRLRELASETPTVNFLNSLLAKALRQLASDMHVEPHGSGARVRYRIDGVLHEVDSISASMVLPVITRLKILAKMDIGERRRPQDGKIELRVAGEEVDIRASVIPVAGGESAVLRFLRRTALVYDIKVLGLSADIEALLLEDLAVTSGVVLLTGPTGSGKTTTLYSFLSRLNKPEVKIITLEDPVEYQLEGINQVQVQSAIGFDFATGLRSVVRQDPDVIMVGEIRDRETASVAMQSALTGHLVFSTVHTNDTPSAYTRLLDLGVEEFLLNAALRSIVGQRLARKLCEHCSVPSGDAAVFLEKFNLLERSREFGIKELNLRDARGCDSCGGTGYLGRVAISEYLRCDQHIRALSKGPDFIAQAKLYARSQGWRTLLEDGLYKAMRGVTTIPEVMRVAG